MVLLFPLHLGEVQGVLKRGRRDTRRELQALIPGPFCNLKNERLIFEPQQQACHPKGQGLQLKALSSPYGAIGSPY